jgi:hypothetical protein
MSVVSVKEIQGGREGEGVSKKGKGVRSYTRQFRVTTSSPYDDSVIACDGVYYAYGVGLGSPYPMDWGSWCTRVRGRSDDKCKTLWYVTASYSSERELGQQPTDDPVLVDWNSEVYQRPYYKDNEDNAILTNAGNYYLKNVDGDDIRWTVTVVKNMPWVPSYILQYANAVNSDTFLLDGVTISPRQAKLSSLKISPWQNRNGNRFRAVTFGIHLQYDTWDKVLLSEDVMQRAVLADESVALMPCYDGSGQPVRSPVPIDADGVQIEDPTPETVVYNTHKIYRELSFGALPLY